MYSVRERIVAGSYSQEQLVVLARQGNEEAYEELFNSVRLLLYKKAQQYSLTSNRYDVEDIFGFGCEAFMKAVKDFDENRGLKFITMLGTYFFNYYNSRFYEKERRSRKYESPKRLDETVRNEKGTDDITLLSTLESQPFDETLFHVEEIVRAYNLVLNTLSERDKHIVELHIVNKELQTDIAEKLNMSSGNVSKIVNTFRKKLKSELKKLELI